ncbi:uncharacterized protein [Arachis hypogaea]|uniref:uncharacterized protein n=1 Tax=Arachis hypogaea TaxID=3818 RepID=UPI000DEC7C6E|nr:uncharacterized protein LOC112747007 [Arachis hypogaea]XP_025697688.1 uncharacterized protein LOC112799913 [Arachis hypogaea]
MADELYKKGIDGSLSRYLSLDGQSIALGEVHNGICGPHQAGKKMKWVLYRNHVYWPSMIKDSSRRINMVTSTPYYAQANGQVEAANKRLSQVLWAYRNSPRVSTGTSPYKLVYGHDAVLPLEINLNTLRVSKQSGLPVDDYWNAMFDELNKLDSERILPLENIIRQKESIVRSYNRRIKEKSFGIGKLVLKVILPMEKKLKFFGKWSHAWEGPFQVIGTYSGNAYEIKDIESEKIINSINGKYLKQYYYCLN